MISLGWSLCLTHKIPCFGWWQQPRGEPRRIPSARGLRRGLGQTRDHSAMGVEMQMKKKKRFFFFFYSFFKKT